MKMRSVIKISKNPLSMVLDFVSVILGIFKFQISASNVETMKVLMRKTWPVNVSKEQFLKTEDVSHVGIIRSLIQLIRNAFVSQIVLKQRTDNVLHVLQKWCMKMENASASLTIF